MWSGASYGILHSTYVFMHHLMQAVPTAPLLIFPLVFLLYWGDLINREAPGGRESRGGSQALLASAKQWDKRQQAEMRKNFFNGQVTKATGFHGISPVQSPALTDFRWSCWCSAFLQKLVICSLQDILKWGLSQFYSCWKLFFVKSLALHESSVVKARIEAVIYNSIHLS